MACKAKEGIQRAVTSHLPGVGAVLNPGFSDQRVRCSWPNVLLKRLGVLVGLMVMMTPMAINAQDTNQITDYTPKEIYEGETLAITLTLTDTAVSNWKDTDSAANSLINARPANQDPSITATHQTTSGGTGDWYLAEDADGTYLEYDPGPYFSIENQVWNTQFPLNDDDTLTFYLHANTDNANSEGDETLVLVFRSGGYYNAENFSITLKDGPRPVTDGVTVSPTSLALTELGADSAVAKTYTVVLATNPTVDVTVTATVPAANQSDVQIKTGSGSFGNSATLTFTAGGDGSGSGQGNGNWAVAQTVTVRALNDADATSEPSFNLTHSASAASGPYNNIAIDPVAVTLTDAGHGVVVSESSLSVAENDATATYTVVLKSQPSGNVVISATSGATAMAEVDTDATTDGNQGTLTFTTANWDTPQTVTITGKGAGSTAISHMVSTTADATNYPTSTTIPSVAVAVSAATGVTITETSGSTVVSEDGSTTTDTYDLVLTSAPTHDVTVTVAAGSGVEVNKAGGSYESSQMLTFTPSGTGLWSTAQTITVKGVADSVDNPGGGRDVTITHATTSTDPRYTIAAAGDVVVRVTDDDATTVILAGVDDDLEEGQTREITLTLGRGLVAGEVLTVPLTFGGTTAQGIDYTLTGTAADGVDYTNLNNANATVEFTGPQTGATATTATLTLRATADSFVESSGETVVIGLGTLTNTGLTGAGGVAPTDDLADFTITDPPPQGGVTVSATSLALTELGTSSTIAKTYTLVLATNPTADVTLTVANGDATAVAVDTDSTMSGDQTTLTFTAGGDGSGSGQAMAPGRWRRP